MSTSDEYSQGNYGLYDIIEVLEFIQSYISIFHGDPGRVTLMGSGSGAASIGLLMVSPKTQQSRTGGTCTTNLYLNISSFLYYLCLY